MHQLLCCIQTTKASVFSSTAFDCLFLLNSTVQKFVAYLHALQLFEHKLLGMFPNRLCLNPGLFDLRNVNIPPQYPSYVTQASTSNLVPKAPSYSPGIYNRQSVYYPLQNYMPYTVPQSVLMQSSPRHSPVKPVAPVQLDVRDDIRANILKKINHISQSDSPPCDKPASPSTLSANRLSPKELSKPVSPSTSVKSDDKMYTSKLGKYERFVTCCI